VAAEKTRLKYLAGFSRPRSGLSLAGANTNPPCATAPTTEARLRVTVTTDAALTSHMMARIEAPFGSPLPAALITALKASMFQRPKAAAEKESTIVAVTNDTAAVRSLLRAI